MPLYSLAEDSSFVQSQTTIFPVSSSDINAETQEFDEPTSSSEFSQEDSQEESFSQAPSNESSFETENDLTNSEETSLESTPSQFESIEESTLESASISTEFSSESETDSSSDISSEEESSEAESTETDELIEFSLLDFERAANYASITSCLITGDNTITINASFQQEVPSLDQKLYLFELETYETSIEKKKPIASTALPDQATTISITTNLNTEDSSRLYSKFILAVFGPDDTYYPVSGFSHITNPEVLAPNQNAFPSSTSKKGLLVNSGMFSDMDELNVQHALVNIELHRLLSDGDLPYTYNGTTYYINSGVLSSYDNGLKHMAANNIVTSCVLLVNYTPSVPELVHPNASGSSSYYAMNTATKEGIRCISAIIHFLAERYTRTDKAYGYIANWIVGNEVANPKDWNNMGNVNFTTYMQNYSRAVRVVSTAVKSCYKNARIYVSLDHYWQSVDGGRFNTVSLLTQMQSFLKSEGDVPWEIAHHPYPLPLTDPDFTDDPVSNSQSTPIITFKNLNVLTDFLQGSSMRNPDGSVKHVILSEQGFTSVDAYGQNVSEKQAAMFAYAYYIIDANPYIDSLILNRHVDHSVEVSQNINFGLWETDLSDSVGENPSSKKEIWEVFKYIDTNQSTDITKPILKQLGASDWNKLVNGYEASKYQNLRSIETGILTPVGSFTSPSNLQNNWINNCYTTITNKLSTGVEAAVEPTYSAAYKCIIQKFSSPLSFYSKSIFGMNITVKDIPSDFARVRVRIFSNEHVFDSEALVPANVKTTLGIDLKNWPYRNSVDRIQIWVKQSNDVRWTSGSFRVEDVIQASSASASSTTVQVSNEKITNQAKNSYRVTCDVFAPNEIDRVQLSTWNDNNSNKKVTHTATLRGQTASCTVDVSSITDGEQSYTTQIIAYDKKGNASAPVYISTQLNKPILSSVMVTELNSEGYTVTCNATSTSGLSYALCPTWTNKNGQDDIVWHKASVQGSLVRCRIPVHNGESGTYTTHIYVYDVNGNVSIVGTEVNVPPHGAPSISNIRTSNLTSSGYTVSCNINSYYGIREILFPTWTSKDGQDDIIWYKGKINGNTVTVTIPVSDHNGESGTYFTHIYAYDVKGNESHTGFQISVPKASNKQLTLSNLSVRDITASGYTVTATVNEPELIQKANGTTWTTANGKDDLTTDSVIVSGDRITYYVKTSKHNKESGEYYSTINITTPSGTVSKQITVNVPKSASQGLSNLTFTNITSNGYTVSVTIADPSNISSLSFPTWTEKNGQDDIIWGTGIISGNTATYNVKTSDHNKESGTYHTHVYLTDKNGKQYVAEGSVTVPSSSGTTQLSYTGHIQNIGWQDWASDGEKVGTSGKSLRIEALKIKVTSPFSGSVQYRTHVQNIGWQSYVSDGELSGTSGKSLRLEALQIRLTGTVSEKYDIYYRTHAQDLGWLGWAVNDGKSGTAGLSKRLEAMEIRLVEKGGTAPGSTANAYVTNQKTPVPSVIYTTHVQNIGWQTEVSDGVMAGTKGKGLRLEGIKIRINGDGIQGGVEYSTHIQNIGWQAYVTDGAMSGTKGKSLRLEGIKIRLTGSLSQIYSIEYRTHVQNAGWQNWVRDDTMSGTKGKGLRLEGIEIRLVRK